ncbi:MAG: metal-sensitive transcriptional regulator [Candidatus Pacebacteria bacterium]|nr:metal-sensitive transcriptional regulator [Candidatus Paceibacterota bacterium]PIR60123.1 MAG: transcriptional regulator [Candidatus Pacebacteria bacterium CG10_big_fil_rev_8_21_14_0_10_44_54]
MQDIGSTPLSQLKRISGQLKGVIKMYEDERDCIDTVHQIVAARNSLSRVARDLLTSEACSCVTKQDTKRLDATLKELLK